MKRINLKVFRIRRDLKQQDLANILGVDISYYNLIENGKRNGSEEVWSKLSSHFNLSQEEIAELKI